MLHISAACERIFRMRIERSRMCIARSKYVMFFSMFFLTLREV